MFRAKSVFSDTWGRFGSLARQGGVTNMFLLLGDSEEIVFSSEAMCLVLCENRGICQTDAGYIQCAPFLVVAFGCAYWQMCSVLNRHHVRIRLSSNGKKFPRGIAVCAEELSYTWKSVWLQRCIRRSCARTICLIFREAPAILARRNMMTRLVLLPCKTMFVIAGTCCLIAIGSEMIIITSAMIILVPAIVSLS